MIGLPLLERKLLVRLALATLVIGACAAVLGWNAGTVAPPVPLTAAETSWALPPADDGDPARDIALLKQRKPWSAGLLGTRPTSQNLKNAPPTWRLGGIVERSGGPYALILTGPGPTPKLNYLRIGDGLPDGRVLLDITPNSAVVEDQRAATGRRIYKLFSKQP